jgi:hypothetical protein
LVDACPFSGHNWQPSLIDPRGVLAMLRIEQ